MLVPNAGITWHEVTGEQGAVDAWRVRQLHRLGLPLALANAVADRVDRRGRKEGGEHDIGEAIEKIAIRQRHRSHAARHPLRERKQRTQAQGRLGELMSALDLAEGGGSHRSV